MAITGNGVSDTEYYYGISFTSTTGHQPNLNKHCQLSQPTPNSFKSPDGKVYYGLATFKGMWLFSYPMTESSLPDLGKYRLRIID
ncbi:hypothetical protein FRX31_005117, partial [Thalictrum thalictroides]